MSLFNSTQSVPAPYEVVSSIAGILRADVGVLNTQAIESVDHIFEHHITDPRPNRHIVIRIGDNTASLQTISGRQIVPILIEASIHQDELNYHQFLDMIHRGIFSAVVNQKPVLTQNTLVLPYYRQTTPSSPEYDDVKGEWYSVSLYYAVIQPI